MKNMNVYAFADEASASVDKQIAAMKRNGLQGLEIRNVDGVNISDITVEKANEVRQKLKEAGLEVWSIGSPLGKIGIGDDFDAHMAKFRHTLEIAKILECNNIRLFSFYLPGDKEPESYRDEVVYKLQQMVEAARDSGIDLCHENEKGIYGDNAIRCKEILDTLNCDYLKATFDPANFVQIGQNTLEAFDILEDYIEYMHIKDAKFLDAEVVPAGYGDGNIKEILTRLSAKGWNGFLSLEPHLGDFVGFSDLEENAEKYKKPSDADLFDIAYKSLDKIVREV